MADETVIPGADSTPVDPAPSDPTPVDPTPVDPAAAPTTETPNDPNDPYSLLEQAMKTQLGDDPAPEALKPGEAPAVPQEFQNALALSEFVKSPQHVEQAVRAADEVWKVASGQVPVGNLLESMRTANPQGYEKVVADLVPYIEQVTGKKFGGAPETPPDPRDQRLSALEQRYAQEEQQRQQAAYQQQVTSARNIATEFLTKSLKGTFAEGSEAFVLAQCAAKAGIPEQQMVQQLLSGNTKTLETAMRAVQKEETARLKKYNDNLVKSYRTLKNGVPGVKGNGPAKSTPADEAYLPGETAVQYATRRFNAGQ